MDERGVAGVGDSGAHGSAIEQVDLHRRCTCCANGVGLGGRPHHSRHRVAGFDEGRHDATTEHARGSGDEHSLTQHNTS